MSRPIPTFVFVAALVSLLGGAGPAPGDITVTQTFTNHTGVTVNDLHWVFNTVETVNSINGGVFPNASSSDDGTQTFIDFSGAALMDGSSANVGVTFNDNTSSPYSANWTIGGVGAGNAYAPFSYGSSGVSATQWVVELDNKNIYNAYRLLVQNLQFAISNIEFNAGNLAGASLTFDSPRPPFVIEIGEEELFNVNTGSQDLYVVAQGNLAYVDGSGNIMPGTESSFRAEATPEPATLSLLALGGLAVIRRRRK